MNPSFWKGKRVFVTGHTGFKGSWLIIWLTLLGAKVYGYSLKPQTDPNMYDLCQLENLLSGSTYEDIRNRSSLQTAILMAKPEIVFHLAAQPLIRESYLNPIDTYETNVLGTAYLLEAVRMSNAQGVPIKAVINVTTDKCYKNKEWVWGYRERDELGGSDPYSSSKACSELITDAYRRSYFYNNNTTAVASARAGNVIGGGDWSPNRLIPDCLTSLMKGVPIQLRHPSSIRPWQHVCEPLAGYLLLAEKLVTMTSQYADCWNFGPNASDMISAAQVTQLLSSKWGGETMIEKQTSDESIIETAVLRLDCSKAIHQLGWKSCWNVNAALDKVVEWTRSYVQNEDLLDVTIRQIEQYELDSRGEIS